MSNETKNEFNFFENKEDQRTVDDILSLDQKLKELRDEVGTLIETSSSYEGDDRDHYIKQITSLAGELDQAIKGIATLTGMLKLPDEDFRNTFIHSEEMQKFKETVTENLQKITQMINA